MNGLAKLPPSILIETIPVLRQLSKTHQALAELKGFSTRIPNKNIMINAAMINEAKNSSEIENIVTTHDELYRAMNNQLTSGPAKEVIHYRRALWQGYQRIKENGFLSIRMMIEIQSIIEDSDAGIRKVPGTVLKNDKTGEVIYTPPASYHEIMDLLGNLESYINEDGEVDDLIKLAIIHYQFESIHPFYDGNGRTGRIINILYLVLKGLLDSPILYLSKYINQNKAAYYTHLQDIQTKNDYEGWILYILQAIEQTSINTLKIMKDIENLIQEVANKIKETLPKIYCKELIELLFHEVYTKIIYIEQGLQVSRKTASTYLIALEQHGFLTSEKVGKEKIYINQALLTLIKSADF